MYSRRLRSTVSLILVLILSFMSVLEVSAASLKANVVSTERTQDGKQKISINSVVDVTYTDIPTFKDVKFTLSKNDNIIDSQIKNRADVTQTNVVNSVYSMQFSNIYFQGLEAGEEYSLVAEYAGKGGLVTTTPQAIHVPSTTGIEITVERMTKDSNTYEVSSAGEIRSDDKNIRLTILNDGLPLAKKGILVANYYSPNNNFVTDASGQVELKSNPNFYFSDAVIFVMINQNTDQYEVTPLYVNDLKQAGTHTVAIRYLDAQGKLFQQRSDTSIWPSGMYTSRSVPGYDVLVLNTASFSGNYTTFIRSAKNEMYMFQTSYASLSSSEDGSRTTVVQDASDYSRINLQYTWNGAPLSLESYSIIPNNQYKQINTSIGNYKLQSEALYVKKNKEYEITAVANIPGTKDKVIIRNQVNPTDSVTVLNSDAVTSAYSELKLQLPERGNGNGIVQLSYLNDKYNYNQVNTYLPAQGGSLYVKKGEEIHRLTATAALDSTSTSTSNGSNMNQVVLESFFSPTEAEYSFKAGSTYDTNISLNVSSYYDVPETRNQIVLGETIEYRVVMTDESKNNVDMSYNHRFRIVDEAGTVIDENQVSWTQEDKDENLQRVDKREWKPVNAGTYKIQMYPYNYSNGGYVYGEMISEAVLKVLPKQEFDIEVRGTDGKLVDMVNKPYLTTDQADKVTVTVREHVTGAEGKLLAGVEVKRYGTLLGVTNDQGILTIPSMRDYSIDQLVFKKADYLSKTVSIAVIDPKNQAVIRVRGLDKPEGASYAGGVPLDSAYIQAVIKKDDGSYSRQSQYIAEDDQQALLVTQSPSIVGIDFMRYNRSYMGIESKYGYYMYGSIRTEPGKEYSMVLDARQPAQQVRKVNLTQYLDELSIVRKELTGASYVPYVIDSNDADENYFYATEGTYSALAHTSGDTFIYRDIVIGAGDNTLTFDESASNLATLIAPESGAIYGVEYITPNQSRIKGYAFDAAQVQLTPGEVTVQLDQSIGRREYQYNIHFAAGTLKASTVTELKPQAISGLDIVGLKDGKLIRSAGDNWLDVGLVDTAGNSIGQIKKPQILVSNRGWSNGYNNVNPESASYEIQDVAGKTLFKETSTSYPMRVYTFSKSDDFFGDLTDGTYVLKAQINIDGQTYSLDKKFTLETTTGIIVNPGDNNPGEEIPGSGSGSEGSGSGGQGSGGSGSGVSPTPAPSPSTTVNDSVEKQNNKLQDLLKDTTATATEKAAAAQSALTSIADTLKSVTTPLEAEQGSKSLSQALESASQLLATIKDPAEKQKIVSSISNLVGSAPYLMNKLDSAVKAADLAHALIQNAADVLNNAQGIAATEIQHLKQGVISSSQAAINKAGEVTIAEENVTVAGNAVSSQLNEGLISKQIELTKQALTSISNDLTSKLGTGLADDLKLSLTVKVPSMGEGMNKLNTSLPAEVLTLVKDNGIDGLKIQMDQTAFTIDADTFGKVEAGQNITLAAEVVENAVVNKPSQADPLATIPVMEFSASVGDKEIKSFAKPINVTFDVSSIDTSKYSEANLENLTVYVLNEESLTWEAVGGKYDPVTQTVSALRGHFSKYTVMMGTATFSDVLKSHWAAQEINYLLTKGIVDQSSEFHPSDKVTRQQFASWIAKAYGLDGKGLTLPFKDINTSNSNYDEIAAVYAAGIVNGKSATTFEPEASITREEIATMLARALTTYNGAKAISQPEVVNSVFTDTAKISKWAAASIALTKSTQLFEGFEDKTFRPNLTASKAEAAALIYRLYQLK